MDKKSIKEFELFLLEEELSKNTIGSYVYAVSDFFNQYDELTKANAISWKESMLEQKSPKTVNLRLNAIRRYSTFIGADITIKPVKVQKQNHVENAMTIDDFNKLLAGLENDGNTKWKIHYLILGRTGVRISEALRLKKSDIDKGFAEIRTKGKVRRIMFPENLLTACREFYKDAKPDTFLISNKYGERMTSRGFACMLKKHADKYGISEERAHPHAFRHMFAVEFLKRNNNVMLLADVLGHSRLDTTMIYARMSAEEQQAEVDKAVNW